MRIVVKIGSNIVTKGGDGLNERRVRAIAAGVARLQGMGHEVVIVSSGAIAAGMKRLGLKSKPRDIMGKQASAAVGQPALMWLYERSFKRFGKTVAQVLLTRDGLSDRVPYINSKNTLRALIARGVVPVINENDTVATDEIRFGDNDQLAAMVAALIEADRLVILSDVAGLYTEDPRRNPKARLIRTVESITDDIRKKARPSSGSAVGTGGMYSKLLAAERAMRAGITVNIIDGSKPRLLVSLIRGGRHGTEFRPRESRLPARKGWIAFGIRTKGSLVLDDGAVKALTELGRSLLPSGIVAVEGAFHTGDAVYCLDARGNRLAKGLANYSSAEISKIKGKKTSEIEQALGYRYSDEVIHRDNVVILKGS
ncbi:MAG: glutamate 5-kinase [Thermodesulfovibrionales bacterium]